ncbi:unnamed protein product [Arctogadus glacialis]
MSEDPENGPFYRKACEAVQQGSFNGIALHGDRGQKVINPTKFYEALCQSMKERMVRSEEESLFTKINILNPETWPSPLPVMYGESELRELCDQVKVGFTGVKQAYQVAENVVKATCMLHNFLRWDASTTIPARSSTGTSTAEPSQGLQNAPRLGTNNAGRDVVAVREKFAQYFMSEAGRVPWQDNI